MPRGYYDNNGDFIKQDTVVNVLFWQPNPHHQRLICSNCHKSLNLYPINRDYPAEFYSHGNDGSCDKHITVSQRNKAFIHAINKAKKEFELKVSVSTQSHNAVGF